MMIRSFLPVGQGAFYCEQFMDDLKREWVNVVYDCGSSTNVKLVEEQIKNNFEKDEIIHGNMILTEGLVLQEEKIWKSFLGKEIIPQNNSCELYFEEHDIEAFVQKLERLYPPVQYVNKLMTDSWGQKVVRFYDLDGNLIEVGTPM